MSDTNSTQPKPTSHDYARQLRLLADWLESRPNFEVPHFDRLAWISFSYLEKDTFLAAVKSLGSGEKKFAHDEIKFTVNTPFARILVSAPRSTVCRLIRPAEYECEPLLSPTEETQLGGG